MSERSRVVAATEGAYCSILQKVGSDEPEEMRIHKEVAAWFLNGEGEFAPLVMDEDNSLVFANILGEVTLFLSMDDLSEDHKNYKYYEEIKKHRAMKEEQARNKKGQGIEN